VSVRRIIAIITNPPLQLKKSLCYSKETKKLFFVKPY
jgi:hypothetical protein